MVKTKNVKTVKKSEKKSVNIIKHTKHTRDRPRNEPVKPVKRKSDEQLFNAPVIALLVIAVFLMAFNQFQIGEATSMIKALPAVSTVSSGNSNVQISSAPAERLGDIDLSGISSTAQTVAAVFPLDKAKTSDDVMNIMFPTGTPEYGAALGVSFDDPVNSLSRLSRAYRSLKTEVQQKDPEAFQRFINLASNPYGVSCEFCCGVGPVGATKNGDLRCGCQHNPALLSVALYLSSYTNYTDAEILREVMRWKTLFFPKNMIQLGVAVAGKDPASLQQLPGMVGGC